MTPTPRSPVLSRKKTTLYGGLAAAAMLVSACGGEGAEVTVLDTGAIYDATAERDPCNFGEVFITDGRIAALDLVVLEDDQAFFPLYNASPVFREEVHADYADELDALYTPVAESLDNDTMATLNAQVSAENQAPADVAQTFLEDNGFLAGEPVLEGMEVIVGSKDFDEQLVLGEISVALLSDAGADVTNEVNVGGTDTTRVALESGDIDHYWEYNGTAWISFFGETEPIQDRQEQYQVVADRDLEESGLVWLTPSIFNNTYGIAMSQEAYEELGTDTISEMGALLEDDASAVSLCVESEFNVRDDGLPGMEEHYGFEIAG
jgi:glycine betaine/choline ABC-type transport system substrate-binding protein